MNKALIRSAAPNQGLVRKKEKQMNKLITKARSGVTLVELLVVILIVTILSVSLLPLLKPYIEEAKYAAEPIPVIGSLQTKINLFQYEKDYLPCDNNTSTIWAYGWTNTQTSANLAPIYSECTIGASRIVTPTFANYPALQIDWEDMKGRRMTPEHVQYCVIEGGANNKGVAQYGYAIGAFGNGDGLGKGTGFAALTLVDTVNTNKIVATWRRYKPKSQDQIKFRLYNADPGVYPDSECCLPAANVMKGNFSVLKSFLTSAGWEFAGDGN